MRGRGGREGGREGGRVLSTTLAALRRQDGMFDKATPFPSFAMACGGAGGKNGGGSSGPMWRK